MSRHLIRLQICIVSCAFLSLSSSEQFSETLLITPLPNGDLFSLFNFTIFTNSGTENSEPDALRHRPVLVPWLLQHLANQFGITDLHLSLAQGFWRSRLWGAQLPEAEIPSGTELIAKFGANLFSMPFNVICLVCTAIAIYYGNAIALCTKIMVPIPKKKPGETGTVAAAQPGFLGSMRSRISTKFCGISQRIGYIFRRRPKDEKQE
uniref:Uncharacterized protein n=1 Tax=Globodera pallida TaxID=36090 RepID=A0A183BS52_GLOPA